MYEYIYNNLFMSYDIIKYIHYLYLKYKNYISYTSFELTGYGPDTVYNVFQTKCENLYILICKIIQINNEYIYFPIKIITIFGIWTFIDEPNIKNIDITQLINFKKELLNKMDLEFIFPSFIDQYNNIFFSMFLIKKYNYKIFYNKHHYNLEIDMNIYEYEEIEIQLNKLYDIFFNNFPFGPNIIEYKFNKFIESILLLKNIDDKCKYFKDYYELKNNRLIQKEYIKTIREYYKNKKIYKFQNNIFRMLFYYTYINYFDKYKLKSLCDKFKENNNFL